MRCSKEIGLATSFYWFLTVESDDSDIKSSNKFTKENPMHMINFYKNIYTQFENSLTKDISETILSQKILKDKLVKVSNELTKTQYGDRKKDRLVNIIKNEQKEYDMLKFSPIALPINPNIKINGTIPENTIVFKSAKYPVKYPFTVTNESQEFIKSEDPSVFEIIFKYGDDLRQDQLVLQIISYMDRLLKSVHLDFNFTTYNVLATSKADGFVEFVPNSTPIQDILQRNDDQIAPFIRENSNNDYDKRLDHFITSCAGYCVVTYILGIGDRHLENLLMDKQGKLFHIDFGYILGKDPKPLPPPMKLCKQMVEAMGGKNSKGYEEFKKKCVDAYLCLRTNTRIIVNMFYLMIHSGLNQLSENHEIALNKLHEKFVPNFNPQEASNSLLNKLEESVNAFYPYLMEKFHVWANYFK
jgi:phosphatidylinositol 3-kinase